MTRRIHQLNRVRAKLRASLHDVLAHWRELLRGSRWRLVALLTLTCVQWLLHAALWTGFPAG